MRIARDVSFEIVMATSADTSRGNASLGLIPVAHAWLKIAETPHAHVAQRRRLLESSSHVLKQIATAVGFSSPDAMRRAFARVLGKSPRTYARTWPNETE